MMKNAKYNFFSVLAILLSQSLFAQNDEILMTVGNVEISKADFEYIYNKNKNENSVEKLSKDDYLNLYADLKMKVMEAERLGMDTTDEFQKEFNQYRNLVSKQYLQDSEYLEKYAQEVFLRLKEERSISQIYVPITLAATPADTLKAYNKIWDAYKRLKNKEVFEKLAGEYSGIAKDDGYVGYVQGLQMVLPFEDAVYTTKLGEYSKPFRTQYGYHIIRVNEIRPAYGEATVAHIMKRFPKDCPEDSVRVAKERIDHVYQRLLNGEDFFEVARQESEHEYSRPKGGRISSFRYGQSLAGTPFDSVAFSLKTPGEVSKPIKSWYGWHIIKMMSNTTPTTYENDRNFILKRLTHLPNRMASIQNVFVEKLKVKYAYKQDDRLARILVEISQKVSDDETFINEISQYAKETFCTFADQSLTVSDIIEAIPANEKKYVSVRISLDKTINQELINYEDRQLEKEYPEFRRLMQEYYDGILMYNIMNKNVWEKASNDETGIKEYFEKNKADYKWEFPHFKGTLVCCTDKKTLSKAKAIAKNVPQDSIVNALLILNTDEKKFIRIEKGLFVIGENELVDLHIFGEGDKKQSKYPYFFTTKESHILPDTPDEYTDIKGMIIVDYQNYLEKKWMEELRSKYPVTVNKAVFESIR